MKKILALTLTLLLALGMFQVASAEQGVTVTMF